MRVSLVRSVACPVLLTLVLATAGAARAQEFYRRENVELQLFKGDAEKLFLNLTRRQENKPAEIVAAGAELKRSGSAAEAIDPAGPKWRLTWKGEDAEIAAEKSLPPGAAGAYRRETAEERLAFATERARSLDAELNRVYGEAKAKLPVERLPSLKEAQREWIRFTYEPAPSAQAAAEDWLARGDRAAERIRFLSELPGDPSLLEAQQLRTQLAAAQEADAWPAVAEIARRLLLATPRDSELWETRTRAFVSVGDWPRCAAALAEWARAVPQPPIVIEELRGDLADGLEDSAGAVRAWSAYVKAAPKDTAVRDKLAKALKDLHDWAGAAAVLEQEIEIEATAETRAQLAVVRAMQHDWKRMSAEIRRASKLDASDGTVEDTLPKVERLEKELPALSALERQAGARKSDPAPLLAEAVVFLDTGWPELALPTLDQAQPLAPKWRSPVLLRAAALIALERKDEADELGIETEHFSSEPDDLRAIVRLDAEIAAHSSPVAAPLARRAEYLKRCGQNTLSLADADAALKLEPDNDVALAARGAALSALGREWEAVPPLRRAAELNPRNAQAWLSLAEIEADFHRHDSALAALARLLALEPKNTDGLKLREQSLRSLGKIAEADADAALLQRLTKPAN